MVTDPTLDPDSWSRIQALFHAALERDPESRAEFLETACGTNQDLRAQVESLIEAHEQRGMLASIDGAESGPLRLLREALGDRYEVLHELGSGGMATVYLAHDGKHNRRVAIKLLPPELAATLGGERFLREIQIAAGLQHPHILPLYDSGGAGSVLYYVMPFVEGDTLSSRLTRGALPTKQAMQVAVDVLSALDYAHNNGVVHRDIKPANILLSASGGHAMVADFGIARAVSAAGTEQLTLPGAMIGTPGYMAPEQAVGGEVTPATDVYAVGVVLYECLTGRSWSLAERPQDFDWSDVPSTVLPALKKALAWHRDDRWSSAAQFRDALLQTDSALKTKGSKLATIIVTGVLMVALAVAGRMILSDGTATTAPSSRIAVLPFAVRGNADYDYLAEGLVDLLSTKLDGAGTWRSVDPRLVLGVSRREGVGSVVDPTAGRDIADVLDADLYLLGSVVQVGQQLRLDASLYAGGEESEALIQVSAEGAVDELLSLLDDLSTKLLAAQPEAAGTRLSRIALVTSSSLPALKAYLSGVSYLRAARYQEAADAFQSAIVADSTFALAWYQLSIAADWLLNTELGLEATQRALQYADRLSERDRRLLEARGAVVVDADAVEAERLYRAIVGTYPTDVEAWSQLGELILHWGPRFGQPLEAAREPWIRLLDLEPDRPDALLHLARIDAAANDVDALDLLVNRAAELAPEGDRLLEMRLLQSHVKGDVAAQEQVLADFRQEGDGVIAEAWWSAGAFLDDPSVAAKLAQMLTDESRSSDARVVGYAAIASVGMTQAQWTTVLGALSAMSQLNPIAALEYRTILAATAVAPVDSTELNTHIAQLREFDWKAIPPPAAPGVWFTALSGLHEHLAQYLIGLGSARLGRSDQALTAAGTLAAMEPPEGYGSLIRDWVRGIRGTVAWRAGNIEVALAELEQFEGHVYYQLATASLFHTLAYERFLLARLLEESGRLEEALAWYNSFEGAGLHDRVFEAPAHWRRQHLYLQLGDEATAREHYMRLLELWAEADEAFIPVLDDARRAGG